MRKIVLYESVLGGRFESEEAARKDEDRLPHIISVYTDDLARLVVGGTYGGKVLTAEMVNKERPLYEQAIEAYKSMWQTVQTQRTELNEPKPAKSTKETTRD